MSAFMQYLRDTRTELKHVAWPTQQQTIVYTVLVIALSVIIALYIGIFDFIFTYALERGLEWYGFAPANVPIEIPTQPVATTTPDTVDFSVTGE